jgi:hypothetical protein
VLAYDRNLKARAREQVRIAVVFKPGLVASERERDALLIALEEVAGQARVAGLPVRAVALPWQDAVDFRARLAEAGATALYVCGGLEEVTRELARAARERSVLALGGTREQVVKGLAVGLVDRGERAALVVNQRAAAGQGADLASGLLSLAERVDSAD